MKKIIITGFDSFGPYTLNPTQSLVDWANEHGDTFPGIKLIGITLPCTYSGAHDKLSSHIEKENPQAILSFGLSSSLKKLRIETKFKNKKNGKYADANGERPPKRTKISDKKSAPPYFSAPSNADNIVEKLIEKDISVETSIDADTFICNSLGYLTCQEISKKMHHVRFMFMHIPWLDSYEKRYEIGFGYTYFSTEKMFQAMEVLIKEI